MRNWKRRIFWLTALLAAAFLPVSVQTALAEEASDTLDTLAPTGLSGEGTVSDPYLISSAADLVLLSDLVNGGETFEGDYFLQTADIDLRSVGSFRPIGCVEGTYFDGTYDGNGYTLSNLVIDETSGTAQNALFSNFAGQLSNLGVVSGKITGANCATFAAAGVPYLTSTISNCYTLVDVDGFNRSSAIADNYNGEISYCFTPTDDPLVFSALSVSHSYATSAIHTGGVLYESDNEIVSPSRYNEAKFIDAWNEAQLVRSMYAGDRLVTLAKGKKYPAFRREQGGFAGKGTTDSPYLLETLADWVRLSVLVNSGQTFQGKTFAMTADVDFSSLDSFVTIGTPDSGSYFAGLLDGRGHTISHMTIDRTAVGRVNNNALFGMLDGVVINLVMEESRISGGCVASIAIGGSAEARIVNCAVRNVALDGVRKGGIVDNFAGKVADCLYEGADRTLVGYEATTLVYCVTNDRIVRFPAAITYTQGNTGMFRGDEEAATELMNKNLLFGALRISFDPTLLRAWADGKPQGEPYALSGSGVVADPVLIQSESDLVYFAAKVNSGTTYQNLRVKQTRDLDLAGVFMMPIGLVDSTERFYGTYDGGGHTISNLLIEENELAHKNGLFGSLFGVVMNLGIESGAIYGTHCGGLASEGYTLNTKLINCYSRAYVYGSYRQGGLVDNFGGNIINCWYDNEQRLDLAATRVGFAYHCFSCGELVSEFCEYTSLPESVAHIDFEAQAAPEAMDEAFNRSSLSGSMQYGYSRRDMVLWEIDDEGRLAFSDDYFVLNRENLIRFQDILLQFYFWNIVAILAIVVAVIGIAVSFLLEGRSPFRSAKKKRKLP